MRNISITLLLFLFINVSFSQPFSLTPRTTNLTRSAGTVGNFYMDLVNLTNQNLQLTVSYQRINLPSPWLVNLCVGEACYPDFVTTVPFTLNAGQSDSVALGIYPTTNGDIGIASLTVSHDHSSFAITVTCTLRTTSNSIDEMIPNTPFLTHIYPNPFNSQSKLVLQLFRPELVQLTLYNLYGQKISSYSDLFGAGLSMIELGRFFRNAPSGTYLLKVQGVSSAQVHRLYYLR